jgi:hypothetical protein
LLFAGVGPEDVKAFLADRFCSRKTGDRFGCGIEIGNPLFKVDGEHAFTNAFYDRAAMGRGEGSQAAIGGRPVIAGFCMAAVFSSKRLHEILNPFSWGRN